jgi:hypothetical protein
MCPGHKTEAADTGEADRCSIDTVSKSGLKQNQQAPHQIHQDHQHPSQEQHSHA